MRFSTLSVLVAASLPLLAGCLAEELQPPESAPIPMLEQAPEVEAVLAHLEAVDAVDPDLPGAEEEMTLLRAELEAELEELLTEEELELLLPRGEHELAGDLDLERGEPVPAFNPWHCPFAHYLASEAAEAAAITLYLAELNVQKSGGNYFALKAEEQAELASQYADQGLAFAELALFEDSANGYTAALYLAPAAHSADQASTWAALSSGAVGGYVAPAVMTWANETEELAEAARIRSLLCAD